MLMVICRVRAYTDQTNKDMSFRKNIYDVKNHNIEWRIMANYGELWRTFLWRIRPNPTAQFSIILHICTALLMSLPSSNNKHPDQCIHMIPILDHILFWVLFAKIDCG